MMRHFLPVLMLIAGLATASRADSGTGSKIDPDASGQQEYETTTDLNSSASPYGGRSVFREHMQTRIVDAVAEALEKNPDISDEDKEKIKQSLRDSSRFGNLGAGEDLGAGKTLIATMAILLIFGSPIMLVAVILYAGHRKRRTASETASQFLASGQQVPPEVWRGLVGDASPRSNLHKGMIMLGAGLGIFLCFWLIGSIKAAYVGLIPLFIGFAQLLIWKLEQPKTNSGDEFGE